VELWWTRQERTLPVCLPSFVCMIFTSRRHIGKRCPRFFLPSPLDSFACNRVRNMATYDTFLDGFLWSLLSYLAHSVTIGALWVVRRSSKKAAATARRNAHASPSPSDENEKPSRSQPKTHNRRSARGEHHTCAQLIVYQNKIQASTNG
jgi:hypothetical protein